MSEDFKPASQRKKFVLLAVLIGIVPLGLFFMRTGKHSFQKLPYLGEKEVNAPGDTTYFTVPPFSFTDQNGTTVTDAGLKDKVLVVDFFFTSCKSICPRMGREMQQLQFKLKEKIGEKGLKEIMFLSHSVDPEHDTPEVLRDYARKLGADTSSWKFLTGDASEIYRQGNLGYLLSAVRDTSAAAAEQFVHSPYFVLVDKRRHIRGMYDGTVTASVDTLSTDIQALLAEEHERVREAKH